MKRYIQLFLICLLTTSFLTAQQSDIAKDIELIINTKSPKFDNQIEKDIVYKQLYGFLYQLKSFKGDKKWSKFMIDFQSTKSIWTSLSNIYESYYNLPGIITYKLDKQLPGESISTQIEKNIEEFNLILHDKSKPFDDLEYIDYLLRLYYSKLSEVFFINDTIKEIYHKNLENLKDKNIKIYLMTDKDQIKKQFGNVTGIAATLVGHEYIDTALIINTRMLFKYHELFMMSALVHELTHIFWAFCYINPEYTKPLPLVYSDTKKDEIKNAFKPFSVENPLKEGIAEYMNAKFNLLSKYGFIEDVDFELHNYFEKTGAGFDLSELSSRIYKINDKAPTYDISHSLFKYICNNYGFDKALKLTYSEQKDNDYYNILGVDFKTINVEWNNYIKIYGQK